MQQSLLHWTPLSTYLRHSTPGSLECSAHIQQPGRGATIAGSCGFVPPPPPQAPIAPHPPALCPLPVWRQQCGFEGCRDPLGINICLGVTQNPAHARANGTGRPLRGAGAQSIRSGSVWLTAKERRPAGTTWVRDAGVYLSMAFAHILLLLAVVYKGPARTTAGRQSSCRQSCNERPSRSHRWRWPASRRIRR